MTIGQIVGLSLLTLILLIGLVARIVSGHGSGIVASYERERRRSEKEDG